MGRLENKVTIITGASGGIGAAAARRFVSEGAKVMLVDLDADALARVADPLGEAAAVCVADVTDEAATRQYVQATVDRFGGVDVLLANAGIEGTVKPIVEQDVEMLDRVLAVNVRGVWLGLKHVFPVMEASGGGSVVITASVAGLNGTANVSPYITSKHAVMGLMKSAALEGAPSRIRVNCVNPAPIETRMMRSLEDGFMPGDGQAAHAAFAENIPMSRYGEPDEVANVMLFLASDEASYVTGSHYLVDGGSNA